VFQNTPSIEELAAVVNRTDAIRELSSNSASVDVTTMNVPRLRATLNVRRDRDFRMRASLPVVMGAGIDLGSNNELFWFEVPEGMSKKLYYARHDQYQQNLNHAILPVDPTWIIDALGLVHIDPSTVVAGPVQRPDGKLEVRSTIQTAAGMYQRVCFIEPSAGYVTNQFLYDPSGKEIATSIASNHEYHADVQCALPHTVQLKLMPSIGPPLGMKIEIGSYALNQLLSGDPQLFSMPQTASEAVDLNTLGGAALGGAVVPVGYHSPAIGYAANRIAPIPMRGATRSP
tara:strand:- start:38171 stop:39031 length:861 start_codon:yes stop_codon:yes gene_type:complete